MPYVDGFVIPVPKKQVSAYRNMARKAGSGASTARSTTRNASPTT